MGLNDLLEEPAIYAISTGLSVPFYASSYAGPLSAFHVEAIMGGDLSPAHRLCNRFADSTSTGAIDVKPGGPRLHSYAAQFFRKSDRAAE